MSELATTRPQRSWRNQRSLFIVIGSLAIMAAVWSWLAFASPRTMTLDQHVHAIASQLRCPVCQDESVADSPSTIAQQMRNVIREQILEGKSDQDIIQYFLNRYGAQNIGWSPPWQGFSALVWIVPIVLMVFGVAVLVFVAYDWQHSAVIAQASAIRQDQKASAFPATQTPADPELEPYRHLLEEELAAEDPLFRRYMTEG